MRLWPGDFLIVIIKTWERANDNVRPDDVPAQKPTMNPGISISIPTINKWAVRNDNTRPTNLHQPLNIQSCLVRPIETGEILRSPTQSTPPG